MTWLRSTVQQHMGGEQARTASRQVGGAGAALKPIEPTSGA